MSSLARPFHWLRQKWAEIRAWRRLKFTRAGAFFTLGALAIGFAAINTGNNLLYLLLGAMLGAVAVSGWLSEQTIRALEVRRTVPTGTPTGAEARIRYEVVNRKGRLASYAVELTEAGLEGRAFLGRLGPAARAETFSGNIFSHRGVYRLGTLTIGTDFPFGLFRKERDVMLPDELVIWPRTDRAVRAHSAGAGQQIRREASVAGAAPGARGEYRGLREYRPGDDPRDIHWRSSARLNVPVVREYDQDASETVWIALDVAQPDGPDAEAAVEIAASLAARSIQTGAPVGLSAGEFQVQPGTGAGHLELILDALARTDFGMAAGPQPPVDRAACVLVTVPGGVRQAGWADILEGRAAKESQDRPRKRPLVKFLSWGGDA